MTASPLIVDGTRECVRLVAALPSDWTTDGERLVLLAMACDAFERESAPGLDNLAAWTGMNRRSVGKILDRLQLANANRPSLLVKTNVSKGRATSRYRLQLSPTAEVQPLPTAEEGSRSTSAQPPPIHPPTAHLPFPLPKISLSLARSRQKPEPSPTHSACKTMMRS